MAKYHWSTPANHWNNTANIRAQGQELEDALTLVGVTRTGDTGQIDWSTVVVGAVSAVIGYVIYNILGGSLKMKVVFTEPASLASTLMPRTTVTVGTGTDGAGNLTGQIFTGTQSSANNTLASAVTPYPSFLCATSEFFGLAWKFGASTSGGGFQPCLIAFSAQKSVDDGGTPDGEAYFFLNQVAVGVGQTGNTLANSYGIAAATAYGAAGGSANFSLAPFSLTDTTVGGDKQLFPQVYPSPRHKYAAYTCGVLHSELPVNTTFTGQIIGSTPRTFISVGNAFNCPVPQSAAANYVALAMLWE